MLELYVGTIICDNKITFLISMFNLNQTLPFGLTSNEIFILRIAEQVLSPLLH